MEYFCLNCKKKVDTYMNIFMGFKLCCKNCGHDRLLKFEEIDNQEFEKLSDEFRNQTENL